MTIADSPVRRTRRPSHRPAPGSLLKRRRRRRRAGRAEVTADAVLHHLVAEGELIEVAGGGRWLLAPLAWGRVLAPSFPHWWRPATRRAAARTSPSWRGRNTGPQLRLTADYVDGDIAEGERYDDEDNGDREPDRDNEPEQYLDG